VFDVRRLWGHGAARFEVCRGLHRPSRVLRLGPPVLHGFRLSRHPRLRVLIVAIAWALAAQAVLRTLLRRLLVLRLLELWLLMLL
jgi:hypothetical protein